MEGCTIKVAQDAGDLSSWAVCLRRLQEMPTRAWVAAAAFPVAAIGVGISRGQVSGGGGGGGGGSGGGGGNGGAGDGALPNNNSQARMTKTCQGVLLAARVMRTESSHKAMWQAKATFGSASGRAAG